MRGRRHEVLPRPHARGRRQGDRRAQGESAPRIGGAVMPTEIGTKLVTARFGDDGARTLAGYEKSAGTRSCARRSRCAPKTSRTRSRLRTARPRRRGLCHRREVGLCPQGREASPPRLQRRRVRARHLQRPRADVLGSAPPDRGHDHRRARAQGRAQLHLHPRRDDARVLVLEKAVAEAYQRGYLGKGILGTGIECHLTVHRGAGASSAAKRPRS